MKPFIYGLLISCMGMCVATLWSGDVFWAKFACSEALVIAAVALLLEGYEEAETH